MVVLPAIKRYLEIIIAGLTLSIVLNGFYLFSEDRGEECIMPGLIIIAIVRVVIFFKEKGLFPAWICLEELNKYDCILFFIFSVFIYDSCSYLPHDFHGLKLF